MSLYRKYRPQTFSDVVGQDHVVTTLEHTVEQRKLAHAYLFAGSRGTGKTSVARILAKTMLTLGMEDEALAQQIHKGVEDGSLVDLIEIDAASNRRIDDVRDLIERIQFSPIVAKAKVYIIDEAHMLTHEAFNALLKTLEEPPPYAFFILATTELQKIPPTIQSRCQRFTFRHITEEDLIRRLQYIADQEHVTVDRAALRAIAHAAAGGMRDAISLLDQLRALEKIELADVRQRVGETGDEHVEALLAAIDGLDRPAVVSTVRRAEDAGIPMDLLARSLLSAFRERLHAAIEGNADATSLIAAIDTLLHAVKDIRSAPVPGLALESALLTLCEGTILPSGNQKSVAKPSKPPADEKPRSRESIKQAPRVAPPEPLPPPEPPVERASALVEAPELTLDAVRARWMEVVEAAQPAAAKMSLKNGRVVAVSTRGVTVSFGARFHRDRVADRTATDVIEKKLADIFKHPLRLECVVEEERDVTAEAKTEVDLAQAVAEIF